MPYPINPLYIRALKFKWLAQLTTIPKIQKVIALFIFSQIADFTTSFATSVIISANSPVAAIAEIIIIFFICFPLNILFRL